MLVESLIFCSYVQYIPIPTLSMGCDRTRNMHAWCEDIIWETESNIHCELWSSDFKSLINFILYTNILLWQQLYGSIKYVSSNTSTQWMWLSRISLIRVVSIPWLRLVWLSLNEGSFFLLVVEVSEFGLLDEVLYPEDSMLAYSLGFLCVCAF